MVIVAQLVRASDCGSEGRGFETRLSPFKLESPEFSGLFLWNYFSWMLYNCNKIFLIEKEQKVMFDFGNQFCTFTKKINK